MGLFDKIKNTILGSKNDAFVSYQQPKKSNYIPTYHIEDWQPKLKYPEYDKLFSLRKYLESVNLPQSTISKIMKSSNVFGEAKKILTHDNANIPCSEMSCHETTRREKWIKLMSLFCCDCSVHH